MIQKVDGIEFKIKEPYDFGFLGQYGKVFKVFDDQDSGNICFGTDKDGQKYFVKFAGAKTAEYDGEPCDAINRLKATVPIYENLRDKNLIEYIDSKEIGNGFAMVFKWTDGECMGRMYPDSHRKFMSLSNEIRLKVFADIMDFMKYTAEQNFVAIDFYDGSILYDFEKQKTIICDIDFFRKQPVVNDMGRMWGSSIFMSPEEFEKGAVLDEITNVYTLGAMAFALFGNYKRDLENWQLSKDLYNVAVKATNDDREKRQQSIDEFVCEWKKLKGSMNVFDEKYNQLFTYIGDHRTMVLSTAVGDIVNSRMMSVVQFNKKFYFQTDCKMDKYSQLRIQPNVSLCFDNVSIQGKCTEIGKPFENEKFCELYEKYFAHAYQLYSHLENEVLFEIVPTVIRMWTYENNHPYYEIYNIRDKTYLKNKYK